MPKGASRNTDAFIQAVERALELYADPVRLAEQSPLAAPYFLGEAQHGHADSPAGRGRALQSLLRDAAAGLLDDHKRLIDVTFLERDQRLNNVGVFRSLNLSEATYYRHRANAIAVLAHALNQRAVPPLRSERPRAREIVDRVAVHDRCVAALRKRHSVALTGPSGIGKTALAAKIADAWSATDTAAFWFTVRPGLTDQLSSLVFSLAHFLRDAGASGLWRQLVADRGRLQPAQALGLLRNDLSSVNNPLLCIDEADLLGIETRDGAQMLHLLEEVRELAPLLLIGQRQVIEAREQHVLFGLTQDDVAVWFAQEQVALGTGDLARVREATRGNPALIRLLIALCRDGERLPDALGALAAAPSAEVLLNRLWKRISPGQRQLLGSLAVFDGPAPRDAWLDYASDIDALLQRELLVADDRGGLAVPETARAFALQRLPAETLAELHLDAAQVREERGEFTAAARHYLEAGQPALAVWVWFSNRDLETERGHAPAARELFRKLRADELPDADDRRALTLLRAEQFLLTGAADDAAAELDLTRWPRAHPASPLAQELRGDAQQQQGRVEQALAQYRDALQLLDDAQHRQIERLHTKAGYVYLYRVRDLALAQHEADMALSQAHSFRGLVAEEDGRYNEALAQYEAALRLAESMPRGEVARAVTHSHLGHLHMRRGDSAAAIHHLEIAIAHAQRIGQPVNALYDQLNMASALIVAGRHVEALAQAQAALALAEPMGNTFLIAGLTAAAAEACLGANQLDAAQGYAMHSLREEEEVHRAYALTALGHVQQRRGQTADAAGSFEAAVASAEAVRDKYAEAHALRALSAVASGARAEEARMAADRLFDELSGHRPTEDR